MWWPDKKRKKKEDFVFVCVIQDMHTEVVVFENILNCSPILYKRQAKELFTVVQWQIPILPLLITCWFNSSKEIFRITLAPSFILSFTTEHARGQDVYEPLW